ncbi:MAG: heme exporter protein CcmD [Acidiferrobacterales bacterium]
MNWSEFFAMGGYGLYVWGAYGFAAVILVINAIIPLYRRSTVVQLLRQLSRAETGRFK